MNVALQLREWFKANPEATIKDGIAAFPNSHSSNIYLARRQASGLEKPKKRKVKKIKPVNPLRPGVEAVRNVIREQTNLEKELTTRIFTLKEELSSMAKSLYKARDEVKGYQVMVSYFEWQIGLRDSQAGHRGSPV
jgi:hypothetical protein